MRIALLAISLIVLVACEDSERVAEKKRAEQASAEKAVKYKAERDAERDLMKSPALAIPELERRLSGWLEVNGGLATVVERGTGGRFITMHTVPATTPWVVTCSWLGIEVRFGLWYELNSDGHGGGATNELISKQLTRVSLTEDECRPLVAAVGQRMVALLRRP
jgi:hypothetical protein